MAVTGRPERMPGGREERGTGARDWTIVCHHSVGGDSSDLENINVKDRRQWGGVKKGKG